MYLEDYPEIEKQGVKYIKAIRSDELFEKKGILIEFDDDIDMQLAVFKIDGELYCLSNICYHQHAREIYNGIIKDGFVYCPKHLWSYDYKTGMNSDPNKGRACLQTYHIFEEKNYIYIEKPSIKIPKWRDTNYDFEN